MCTHPMVRAETFETYRNKQGGISYKVDWSIPITMVDKRGLDAVQRTFRDRYRKIDITNCGQCWECRLNRAREWATDCMLEKEYGYYVDKEKTIVAQYEDNECWFITLTYEDVFLPQHTTVNTETGEIFRGISVQIEDLQKFWKRVRKHYPNAKIKYLQALEYGSQTYRPHAHAIVFGLPLNVTKFSKIGNNNMGDAEWISPELEELWGLGHTRVGRVTWRSCAYVARYTLKKIGEKTDAWYMAQGKRPEIKSNSRGIGEVYFTKYMDQVTLTDSLPIKNAKTGRPVVATTRFMKLLREIDEPLYLDIKERRKQDARTQQLQQCSSTDNEIWEQRLIKERIMKSSFKDLRRDM